MAKKLRHEILGKKLQFKRYFFLEYTTLLVFGFDCYSKERPFYRPWLSYSTMFAISLIILGMAHYSYVHIPNVVEVTQGLTPFVQSLMVVSKFLILVFKGHEIVDIVQRIWTISEQLNDAEMKILKQINQRVFLINFTYCFFVGFTSIFTTAGVPIIGFLFLLFKGEFLYKVMLTASYPLQLDKPLNYFLIYIWTVYAVFAVALVTAGVDSIFSWCSQNIAGLFRIMQHKVENISLQSRSNNEESNGTVSISIPVSIRKSIIECVVYHQEIIILSERMNEVFYLVTFIEFSMNSLQICLLVYQLDQGFTDISQTVFLIGFLGIVLIQMLMFSHCGQRLKDECTEVGVVAFHNVDWKNWSTSDIKMMLLIVLRSQQPCQMMGVFFYVNMALFISVIQTAGSYIALLRSIQDK